MYHDRFQCRPMELDAIYAAPLDAAARVGVAMPKTELLYRTLRFLETRSPRMTRTQNRRPLRSSLAR
jgi:2-dehydropantoate 2-reductase